MAKVEVEEADLLNLRHIHGVVDQVLALPEHLDGAGIGDGIACAAPPSSHTHFL